ncbi:unnamed protein product [Brassicogethes aeneus]|uniref:Uncharacterized protein n=1 Tax=Brassicogethes aeneus TaxID=1431903 RepID=A0A9P0AZY2_BRAAE|nr:unnamed protein product [Brassicogethes aeneus]
MLLSRSVWGFNTSEKYLRWENPFGGKQKEGRLISFNSDSGDISYLLGIDEVLLANDIDATTCMQRIVCWSVKNASKQVNTGHGKSMDKLLDGVASNDWLNYYIRGTAIDDAIKNGYNGINCSKAYGKCQITQQAIQKLSKNLINAVNGG